MEGKKGECKHLGKYGCKLDHWIINDDACVDCEDYEEEE